MELFRKQSIPDRIKIGLSQGWEIDYWTHELGVSKSELQGIIAKVGNTAAAVRKELRLGRKGSRLNTLVRDR